jgi:hypothetical protein
VYPLLGFRLLQRVPVRSVHPHRSRAKRAHGCLTGYLTRLALGRTDGSTTAFNGQLADILRGPFSLGRRNGNRLCQINSFADRHFAFESSSAFYYHKPPGLGISHCSYCSVGRVLYHTNNITKKAGLVQCYAFVVLGINDETFLTPPLPQGPAPAQTA